jgi:dihydrofolate reductase
MTRARHACRMRKVSYSMGVSLDGFIAGPGGDIGWTAPDEELHRFHNERARATDVQLCGRRLYEVMRYWETAEENPSSAEHELEFARIWKRTRRLVFSTTLERVAGGATLATDDVATEVARLRQESGGDVGVGGAGLAATLIARDEIDEYGLFVYPVVLGAGTPFFPALDARIELRLAETRTFGCGVVHLRYERGGRAID